MNLRFYFCLLGLVCSLALMAQNNSLRGIVKLQSSGSQPLPGVKISSFGASSVLSNEEGMFEMIFQSKHPGDRVSLIINKQGYEVINIAQVESCLLRSNADDLVIIVMAKAGEKDQEALRYYDIIVNNINEGVEKKLASIEAELADRLTNDVERAEFQQQKYELKKERDEWREKAEALSIQMSAIDLDQASGIVQRAYSLFDSGEIEAAIKLLDSEELAKNLKAATTVKKDAEERMESAQASFAKCVDSYMVKAKLCIANRQIREAKENYLIALNADPSNLENTWEVVDFLDKMAYQSDAISVIKKSLLQIEDKKTRWKLLNQLGRQFTINQDFQKADSVFTIAYSLGKDELYFSDVDKRPLELSTEISKAFLLQQIGEDAIPVLERAYEQVQELIGLDSAKFLSTLKTINNKLAVALQQARRYQEAADKFAELIKVDEKLVALSPEKNESDLAGHLNNYGVFLGSVRQWDAAKGALQRSIAIKKKLFENRKYEYGPTLADSYMNLANLHARNGALKEARVVYDTIFIMYEKFSSENPNRFEDEFAMVQMNRGNVLRDLEEYTEAEIAYSQSMEIRKRLYVKSKSRYANYLSNTYQNMGLLYRRMAAYDKAEEYHIRSLDILEEYANDERRESSPRIAMLRSDFGNLYKVMLDISKADSLYNLAAAAYRSRIDAGEEQLNFRLLIALINQVELYVIGLEAYWVEDYRVRGKEVIGTANEVLGKLSVRAQNNFSPYLVRYDSVFTSYSREEIRINGLLLGVKPLLPDSSMLDQPIAEKQQRQWIDKIKELRVEYPNVDTLMKEEAKGYEQLAWIYLLQNRLVDAEEAAYAGLSLSSHNPALLSRLLISLALQKKEDQVQKILKGKTWKDCTACTESYYKGVNELGERDDAYNVRELIERID